ncbi:MAG: DUF6867 family protein [Pseudomonadota bacterium]
MEALFEGSIWPFVAIVVVVGGGAAYMTGRAIAGGWQSYLLLAFYCLLLAITAQFLLFALFERTLLSPTGVVLNFVVLLVFGLLGHRMQRTAQMVTQYSWLNERTTPLSWRAK